MNAFSQSLFRSVLAVILAVGSGLFVAGLTIIGVGSISQPQLHFAVWSLVIGAVLMVSYVGGHVVMLLFEEG